MVIQETIARTTYMGEPRFVKEARERAGKIWDKLMERFRQRSRRGVQVATA